ncbi:hypothetical protein P3339_09705 [Microbulbifer sp. MLAF003]|uniref:hypothetical protein n=1 Tax=Microbulbifer sp. MLAF003 TaxID=3032582 RepID=UPI0024ADB647|nr:hypothetical protein [Microbulbifer sp. MLAF003]WHI53014.1 hypothetical protein P3339_09705 [Microbulbifer sp. MLAF003]
MLKKLVFSFMISGISMSSLSASQDVEITGIGISESTKTVYIGVYPSISDTPCSGSSQVRISLASSFTAKEVYSAALTAFASSKTVNIGYDDSSSAECLFNNPIIQTLYIKK